jgi:hypothetical protein
VGRTVAAGRWGAGGNKPCGAEVHIRSINTHMGVWRGWRSNCPEQQLMHGSACMSMRAPIRPPYSPHFIDLSHLQDLCCCLHLLPLLLGLCCHLLLLVLLLWRCYCCYSLLPAAAAAAAACSPWVAALLQQTTCRQQQHHNPLSPAAPQLDNPAIHCAATIAHRATTQLTLKHSQHHVMRLRPLPTQAHLRLTVLNWYRSLWKSLDRSSPRLISLSLQPPNKKARDRCGTSAKLLRGPGAMPAFFTRSHCTRVVGG